MMVPMRLLPDCQQLCPKGAHNGLNPKAIPFSPCGSEPVGTSPPSTPGLTPSASPLLNPATSPSANSAAVTTQALSPQRATQPTPAQPQLPPAPAPAPVADPRPRQTVALEPTQRTAAERSPPRRGTWCSRFSHTDETGAVLVTTPWIPERVAKDSVHLGDEVTAFTELVTCSPGERAARQALRLSVQSAVNKVSADAVAKMVGMDALGLAVPSAPMQLVVEDCGDLQQARQALADKAPLLEVVGGHSIEAPLLVRAAGMEAEVTFAQWGSDSRRRAGSMRRALAQHPAAGPVACVISTVLGPLRCGDPATGGLAPEAVLLMVLHLCARRNAEQLRAAEGGSQGSGSSAPEGTREAAAALLLEFFRYYDKDFDFSTHSVCPFSAEPMPRPAAHSGAAVSIIDPVCGSARNPAALCTPSKLWQLQTNYFRHCHQVLTKYEGVVPPGARRGYKGRTPLSTIVSMQPLWRRAAELGRCDPSAQDGAQSSANSTPSQAHITGVGSTPPALNLPTVPTPTVLNLPGPALPATQSAQFDLPDLPLSP
eukprot:TRINITY_DN20172_c0_g1_i1.p1 TRINITY_DN20172_c0_g1~~TRINITY_DN20172_c0_g1_i1.p1  ORF type:complete len:541 (+),score=154.88 TRINITY_DN20172_c0_g1_i1:122-1744(+)